MMRIGLFILLLLLIGCGGEPPAEPEQVIRPVRFQRVTADGGKRLRTFSGTARAGVASKLSFRIGGTIQAFPVKLGDRVKAGQLIASLDPKDQKLQEQEAQAGLIQAQAQARNASANYTRIRGLYENNNVSVNDLDAARASSESAEAQVQSIRKRLELARAQLSYTRLTAPISGTIARVNAEINENIGAGQAVAVLNAGSLPEVTCAVPEQLIAEVKIGAKVTVDFSALAGQSFKATVTEVGLASDRTGTTFPVTIRLDQATAEVLPGMAAEVTIIFGEADNQARLFVKPKAVNEDEQGRYVFLAATKDGVTTVVRREVQTGELSEAGLEILSGLETGDMLITAGMRFLQPGMQVKLAKMWEE